MKKIFSFLMMALFSVSLFAADPVTVKSTFTKATVPADNKVTDLEGKVTWNIATEVGAGTPGYTTGKNSQIECLKFGEKAASYFSKVELSTDYYKDYNVTSVKLYVLNNGNKEGTLTVTQGDVTIGSASATFGTTWTELTANTNKGAGGTLTVTYEVAQASYWSYIEVTYEEGEGGGEATHTYTVAGSSDVAFGTTWAPENAANDMIKQEDGTYKWEKSDLTLAAGTVQFKVCEDHSWAVAYPKDNFNLNIAEAGVYTLTITFNPAAESDKVAAVATKTGEAVVVPSVAMHGNFTGDKWADTENFALADNKESASLKLTLAAGNYEFGMRIGGSGNWTSNGVSFTRENASAVIEAGEGNLKLAADEAGEYTFTWTFADNKLTITFPAQIPAAVPLEGDTWKVTEATPLVAGSHYIDEALLKMDGVFATTLKTNARTIGGEAFTHAIQVRVAAYPTAEVPTGTENTGSTSLVITAKADVDVTFFYARQEGDKAENDSKDLIIFDQADLSKLTGEFSTEADANEGWLKAVKKLVLLKDHVYTVAAKGTTLQLHGVKLVAHETVAPEPVLANGYYLIGQKGWDVAALSADLLFTANPENEGEFQLSVTLAKEDGVKVVKVENDEIKAWYPEGMGNEYKVDEAHAGEVTIYFRPEGNSDWADFGGFFYVATSAPVVERVVIGVNVPAEGLGDAGVKIFGTFAEEPLVLEKIVATGWYLHSNIPATADDSFSFCDAANPDQVLCEKDGELWVKFTKKFSDLWEDDTYKDDPVKLIELDLSDADKYAWQTDYVTAISNTAVEAKAVKMIQNGQLFIIRDGKTYTVQGLQVK